MPEGKNTVSDLRRYLETPDNPVSMEEFTVFWKSLTDEEKDDYKNTELPKE